MQFLKGVVNCGGAKSPDSGQVNDELLRELPFQLPERNIAQSVFVLQESGQAVVPGAVFRQRPCAAVFAYALTCELL